jgi:hypothetical protein
LGRGYSWWAGEDYPGLAREPDFVSFEELAASMPERAEDLMSRNNERDSQPTPPGKWRLPGLCAICAATTYSELVRGIWKDFDDRTRWMAGHKYIITIFEGELAGYDPDEWPLFTQGKLLAIAATDAIRRSSDTPA